MQKVVIREYPMTGVIKLWLLAKGFGFIVSDDGGPDVLIHKDVLSNGDVGLGKGTYVEFMYAKRDGNDNKRYVTRVIKISANPPSK